MSNQAALWSMLVLPWLTLVFMKREEIKQWMPAALFVMVTSTLIIEAGITFKLWETHETTFPLNEMISYVYGTLPVGAMWILKYTYGRFWLYATVQLVGSLVLILLVQPWLHNRDIFVYVNPNNLAGIGPFAITVVHLLLVYFYQMWQDEVIISTEASRSTAALQPAAAKPIQEETETSPKNKK